MILPELVFSAIIGTVNLIDCVPLESGEYVFANRDVGLARQPQRQVPGILLTMSAEGREESCLRHKEPWERSDRADLHQKIIRSLCHGMPSQESRGRVICIEKAKWSILPFSGVVDSDPFRRNHRA